ncbi:MAG: hypothetical protein NVSMB65_00370 [Chloroflexota bacterium]
MKAEDILTLYTYNYWATARVLSATAQVPHAQYVAPAPVSHGSLRGTLVHMLATEMVWRARCRDGLSPTAMLTETDCPTLEALQQRWRDEERVMRAYLESLSDEALGQAVSYSTSKGVPFENILWQLLVHVVNHGTQFRAEAGIVLTSYGHSPGDLDIIAFLRA